MQRGDGIGKNENYSILGGTRFFLAEFSSAFARTSLVQSRKTGNCKFDKILCIKFKKKGILIYLYLYIYIFIYFTLYIIFIYCYIFFYLYYFSSYRRQRRRRQSRWWRWRWRRRRRPHILQKAAVMAVTVAATIAIAPGPSRAFLLPVPTSTPRAPRFLLVSWVRTSIPTYISL